MKKLFSVFLALTLVLALCGGAFADTAEDLTGQLVIVHTNDVHGTIDTYAKVAALVDEYEERGAEVLLVDDGDFSQGSVYVNGSEGINAVELMNAVGYDLATLGNHEFDYGWENISDLDEAADFPIISNVKHNGEFMLPQTQVLETESYKVGFFGLETPETSTKAHPAKIVGVTFMSGEELYAYAEAQIAALEAQDVDYVVCLGHLGLTGNYSSIDLLENVEGIDLFIDGHSENTLADYAAVAAGNKVGDAVITSAGSKGDHIGVAVLNADGIAVSDVVVETYESVDETVAGAVAAIKAPIDADMAEIFGKTEVALNGERAPGNRTEETNLGDLIADAILWYALEQGDAGVPEENVVAVTNGGGIRAAVAAGEITKKDINNVLPYGNTVAYITVKGDVLLEALEASTYNTPEELGAFPQVAGIEFTIDTTKEFDAGELYPGGSTYNKPDSINRVTINSINGKDFDPEATYVVVSNDFTAAGGDTYGAFAVSESVDTGAAMDTVVVEYINEVLDGTVTAEMYGEPKGRIHILPESSGDLPFTDVAAGQWYTDAIAYVYENELMSGTSATTFEPFAKLNRAMLVTMLYRLEGSPAVEGDVSEVFSDCADGQWYSDAVLWASQNEIVTGRSDTVFDPFANLNRQEMAAVLYRYAVYGGAEEVTEPELAYSDAANIADWAEAAVAWCGENEIMKGISASEFAPWNSADRATGAVVLARIAA